MLVPYTILITFLGTCLKNATGEWKGLSPLGNTQRQRLHEWETMSQAHSPLSQSPWVNSVLRTELAQTNFTLSSAQCQLTIHWKYLFSNRLHGWEDGVPVLSPHWWWSSNSCAREVWVVLIRETEALSLHIACIRSPANDLDFRGIGRFTLVAKSFSSWYA